MRVALISDLHGNALALRAVLAELDALGVDELLCLGDTATLGPRPKEVLEILRARGCPCIVGNHEAFLLDPDLIASYRTSQAVEHAVEWCRDRLDEEDMAFLRGFASELTLDLGHGRSLLALHGTTRSHMEDLLATTPADQVDEMLGGARADVVAVGHTHVPMLRQHNGMLLVNPGSVGAPFEAHVGGATPRILSHAEYAVVDSDASGIEVRLKRVPIDPALLLAELRETNHPFAGFMAAQLL